VGFFLAPDPGLLPSLRTVSEGRPAQDTRRRVNVFLQAADFYLVASALAQGHVVVSHERPSTSTKNITPFQTLRRERARFVLPAS
jgi:hypothetical protein